MTKVLKPLEIKAVNGGIYGALCVGIALGFTGPALETMLIIPESSSSWRVAKDDQKFWIEATIPLGAFIGCFWGYILYENVGRGRLLLASGVTYLLGSVPVLIGQHISLIYIGRFIIGMAVGTIGLQAPSYITEMSTPDRRGFFGATFQLYATIGILIITLFGVFAKPEFGHRMHYTILTAIGMFFACLFIRRMWGMPETPIWLLEIRDKERETQNTLAELRLPRPFNPNNTIEQEVNDLHVQLILKRAENFKWLHLVQKKQYYKPCIIAVVLTVFQQLSGIYIVIHFQDKIVEDVLKRFDSNPRFTAFRTCFICFPQVLVAWLVGEFMDVLGRKNLLILSGFVHAISLFTLAEYFNKWASDSSQVAAQIVALLCLLIFYAAFFSGYGPIPGMIIGEMTHPVLCEELTFFVNLLIWFLALIMTGTLDYITQNYPTPVVFRTYAVFCIISSITVYFLVVETTGKTLVQVLEEFSPGCIDKAAVSEKLGEVVEMKNASNDKAVTRSSDETVHEGEPGEESPEDSKNVASDMDKDKPASSAAQPSSHLRHRR